MLLSDYKPCFTIKENVFGMKKFKIQTILATENKVQTLCPVIVLDAVCIFSRFVLSKYAFLEEIYGQSCMTDK